MLLDPNVAYLNSGSAGPLPRSVYERLSGLRQRLAEEPVDCLLRQAPALVAAARERLADFIGGEPTQLALMTNVTSAVNLVASGLMLDTPGEILLTDHEYAPMRWCWQRAAQRQGLTLRILRLPSRPSDPQEILEAALAALGPRTRVFFFSHVLSTTGVVMPAKHLCDAARARGVLTVVDGAHGPAFVDLNLADIGCNFYAGSGHKWLLAPIGTAFLYLDLETTDRLEPLQVSWGYRTQDDDLSAIECDGFGRTPLLRRLEVAGTHDICPWLALPEAIDFQGSFGHAAVRARMRELAAYLRDQVTECCGLVSATPEHPDLSGGMVAFEVPTWVDAAGLRRQLWERYRIEVSVIDGTEVPLLRVSTHFFNTRAEAERLAEALGTELTRSKLRGGNSGDQPS